MARYKFSVILRKFIMSEEEGNKKRIAASKYWAVTVYHECENDVLTLYEEVRLHCLDYRFQEEEGDEEKKLHLQGYIQLKKKGRPSEMFSYKKLKWSKARSPCHAREYCCKEDTQTGRYILDTKKPIKLINPTYNWEIEILEMLKEEPHDRYIYWYWEPNGCAGKSAFTKYLVVKHKALVLGGKSADCKYGVAQYLEQKKNYPEVIIFDVPRCNIDFVNFEAIECIKNACFFSGKYEGCMVVGNCPHLIIFADTPPKFTGTVSIERWIIVKIDQEQQDLSKQHSTLSSFDSSEKMVLQYHSTQS